MMGNLMLRPSLIGDDTGQDAGCSCKKCLLAGCYDVVRLVEYCVVQRQHFIFLPLEPIRRPRNALKRCCLPA